MLVGGSFSGDDLYGDTSNQNKKSLSPAVRGAL